MPQMPTSDRTDCRHGHGAQPYAVVHLVLGRLFGRQPDPRHVGRPASTATRALALRDSLSDPPTNCAPEWSARTRIASVAARTSMSRWTKPGSAVGHAAKAEAFTTRFWSPAPLRCAIGSLEPRRTSERMGAMRGAFGWQSSLTEAPNRFVDLSMAPSLPGR